MKILELNITRFQPIRYYQFLRLLRPLLPFNRERLPREVLQNVNMDSFRVSQTEAGDIALLKEDGELEPISGIKQRDVQEDERAPLSEILDYINENYRTDFTGEDKVHYFAEDMTRRLQDQDGIQRALDPDINPSVENRRLAFADFFDDVLQDMMEANTELYRKIAEDMNFGEIFKMAMLRKVSEELSLRRSFK